MNWLVKPSYVEDKKSIKYIDIHTRTHISMYTSIYVFTERDRIFERGKENNICICVRRKMVKIHRDCVCASKIYKKAYFDEQRKKSNENYDTVAPNSWNNDIASCLTFNVSKDPSHIEGNLLIKTTRRNTAIL